MADDQSCAHLKIQAILYMSTPYLSCCQGHLGVFVVAERGQVVESGLEVIRQVVGFLSHQCLLEDTIRKIVSEGRNHNSWSYC